MILVSLRARKHSCEASDVQTRTTVQRANQSRSSCYVSINVFSCMGFMLGLLNVKTVYGQKIKTQVVQCY